VGRTAAVFKDKREFRATLAPVWVILGVFLLITHIREGYFTANVNRLTLYSAIPAVVAIVLGNFLHDKIPQGLFIKLTYVLLLASGLSIVF
jgi:uncharacterized membrane protein YfcA